ncbi:MAG: 5' nucleotidase, NT5C type [Minisyncoccota bacterium]
MILKRRIIGVDFDDVVVDFNAGLALYHKALYGTSYEKKDILQFDLEQLWGCTRAEAVRRVYEFYHSEHHANLLPVEGAVEALKQLREENTLVMITSRPESVRGLTLDLLGKHIDEVFESTHFLGHYHDAKGSQKTKGEVCKEILIDIFIEDSIGNAVTVSEKGIPVLLLDAPWNQGGIPKHITRVFGWSNVLEKLQTITI